VIIESEEESCPICKRKLIQHSQLQDRMRNDHNKAVRK